MTAARSRPCFWRARCTPMATLLKRQKPMARSGSAWWPGGRTAQKALSASPPTTASTAAQTAPTARSAASPERGDNRLDEVPWMDTRHVVEIGARRLASLDPGEVRPRQAGEDGAQAVR